MSRSIECKVGGISFHTTADTLLSVPDSFFQAALSDAWNPSGNNFINIERDGTHFQHILDYLRFGYLPRDGSGRCQLKREVLESVLVEADFYGLPGLVKEIQQLLEFNMKGMRYFISTFYLNSSPDSGGVHLQEFASFEDASKVYEDYKASSIDPCNYVNQIIINDEIISENDNGDNQNIIVNEEVDLVTGKVNKEVFQDGNWKRPKGLQLLCVPLSDCTKDGAMYDCGIRTTPDNREYNW